ncbi:hypothetical protein DOY81_010081, partial [Sarcophaga bullata]
MIVRTTTTNILCVKPKCGSKYPNNLVCLNKNVPNVGKVYVINSLVEMKLNSESRWRYFKQMSFSCGSIRQYRASLLG